MSSSRKPYQPGTLLELVDESSLYNLPRGFYLVLSSKTIEFTNGESVIQYTILFPDGAVENGNHDSYWILKSFREVNPKDYE